MPKATNEHPLLFSSSGYVFVDLAHILNGRSCIDTCSRPGFPYRVKTCIHCHRGTWSHPNPMNAVGIARASFRERRFNQSTSLAVTTSANKTSRQTASCYDELAVFD